MRPSLFGLLWIVSSAALGQESRTMYANFTGTIGDRHGTISLDYFYLRNLTKSKKLELGVGARLTSYLGSAKYFSSAPPAFAIGNKNADSIRLQSPQINALNLALNFGYRISPRFGVGFNIDAIGVSFGAKQDGFYVNGNQVQTITARPTVFNILLIDNRDRGSLNSEFYVRYFFRTSLAVKLAFQHLFTEYTTDIEVQQVPQPNDRFRNKANLFSLGITKQF